MSKVPRGRQYGHQSLEDRLNKEKSLERKEKFNSIVENLGKGLRSSVNIIFPDSTPHTDDKNTNRRAGRTAIAGIVSIVSAIGLAGYYEAQNENSVKCEEVSISETGEDTPAEAASELSVLYAGTEMSGTAYDQFKKDFEQGNDAELCDPYLTKFQENKS